MCSIFFNSVWVVWAYLLISMLYVDKTCSMYCSEDRPLLPVGPSVESNIFSDQRRPSEDGSNVPEVRKVRIFKSWFECNEAKKKHSDWCCIYRPRLDNLFSVRSSIFRLMCYRKTPVQQPSLHDQVISDIVKASTQETRIQTDQPFQSEKSEKKSVESDASNYNMDTAALKQFIFCTQLEEEPQQKGYAGLIWLMNRYCTKKELLSLFKKEPCQLLVQQVCAQPFNQESLYTLCDQYQKLFLDENLLIDALFFLLKEYVRYVFFEEDSAQIRMLIFNEKGLMCLNNDCDILSELRERFNARIIMIDAKQSFMKKHNFKCVTDQLKSFNTLILAVLKDLACDEVENSFYLPVTYYGFDVKSILQGNMNINIYKLFLLQNRNKSALQKGYDIEEPSQQGNPMEPRLFTEWNNAKQNELSYRCSNQYYDDVYGDYNLLLQSNNKLFKNPVYNERVFFQELLKPLSNDLKLEDEKSNYFYPTLWRKSHSIAMEQAFCLKKLNVTLLSKEEFYHEFSISQILIKLIAPLYNKISLNSNEESDDLIKKHLLNMRAVTAIYTFPVQDESILEQYWNSCFADRVLKVQYQKEQHKKFLASYFDYLHTALYPNSNELCRYAEYTNSFFYAYIKYKAYKEFHLKHVPILEWLKIQPDYVQLYVYIEWMKNSFKSITQKFHVDFLNKMIKPYRNIIYDIELRNQQENAKQADQPLIESNTCDDKGVDQSIKQNKLTYTYEYDAIINEIQTDNTCINLINQFPGLRTDSLLSTFEGGYNDPLWTEFILIFMFIKMLSFMDSRNIEYTLPSKLKSVEAKAFYLCIEYLKPFCIDYLKKELVNSELCEACVSLCLPIGRTISLDHFKKMSINDKYENKYENIIFNIYGIINLIDLGTLFQNISIVQFDSSGKLLEGHTCQSK